MDYKSRDYQAEYRRRVQRGAAKGLSRSQARGHPKAKEAHISRRPPKPLDDARLQFGLKLLRQEKGLSETARQLGVSPERLRHHLNSVGAAEKRGRRWAVRDDLPRRMLIYSDGRAETITVADRKKAASVGAYMTHVKQFLETNDPGYLGFFRGMSITDIDGREYPLETDPNALYRLALSGSETFEQIYRIVI